jgi:dCMP deaminase
LNKTRPDWDTYFLGIARAVAARGDCLRVQHGAVVVKDHRIVATGYNGSPPGGPSCLAGECPRAASDTPHNYPDYSNCIALHAEQNAIAYAGTHSRGAEIYITGPPCDMCMKLIKAAGILNVWYPEHTQCMHNENTH